MTALFKIIELNIVMSVISDFMKMPSSEMPKILTERMPTHNTINCGIVQFSVLCICKV